MQGDDILALGDNANDGELIVLDLLIVIGLFAVLLSGCWLSGGC